MISRLFLQVLGDGSMKANREKCMFFNGGVEYRAFSSVR